jgi:hypothetical protein
MVAEKVDGHYDSEGEGSLLLIGTSEEFPQLSSWRSYILKIDGRDFSIKTREVKSTLMITRLYLCVDFVIQP